MLLEHDATQCESDAPAGSLHAVSAPCVHCRRGDGHQHEYHSTVQEDHPTWRLVELELAVRQRLTVYSTTGYVGSERQAVLVISACYLPPRSLPHYHDVTHQLFR